MNNILSLIFVMLACALLTACGQTGPLYYSPTSPTTQQQRYHSRPLPIHPAPTPAKKEQQIDDNTPAPVGNQEPGKNIKPLHSDMQKQLGDQ